jgi:hypothetical protein
MIGRSVPHDPEHARFTELNALAGVLPYHRRDELSALLSDADVATCSSLQSSAPRPAINADSGPN